MHNLGKIDIEKYNVISNNILSDDVIITDERIQHINSRHFGDFEIIKSFLYDAVNDPDYILKDEKHIDTGLVLKKIEVDNIRFQVVLRLHTSDDGGKDRSNSILSAWVVSERRWNRYLKNKNILYKKDN